MQWFALLVSVAMVFGFSSEAHACSCMKQTLEEGVADAHAIFEGKVTVLAPNTTTEFRGREVTLRVERAWKGVESNVVSLVTASNSAACGYPFVEGATYLVYAHRTDSGGLRASLCSLTKPITDAEADLEYLGSPSKALDDAKKKSSRSKGRCSASLEDDEGVSFGLLALIGVAIAFARRRWVHRC